MLLYNYQFGLMKIAFEDEPKPLQRPSCRLSRAGDPEPRVDQHTRGIQAARCDLPFPLHLHITRLPENELYALLADHPAAFHQPRHDELHSHAHNGVQRLYDNPSKKDNLSYSVQILPAFKPDLDLIPTLDLPVGRD